MRQRVALIAMAVLLVALLTLVWLEARAVGAQPPAPAPVAPSAWTYGGSTPSVRLTWWTRPGNRVDTLQVFGGATAAVFCQDGLCVLNVRGVWTRVYADGLAAERYGVYLPLIQGLNQ